MYIFRFLTERHALKSLFVILISLLMAAPSFGRKRPVDKARYQADDIANNFIITDTDGISRALYDYKGKIIVLNFGEWWCGPCNSEWAAMPTGLWNPNKDQGVEIFTIGMDDEPQFNLKADQYNDGWIWAFDHTGDLYWDFGNGYIPYNVILDQEFRVIWQESGYFGNFDEMQGQIDLNLYDVAVHQLDPQYVTASPGDDVTLNVSLTNLNSRQSVVQAFVDVILPGHNAYVNNPMLSQRVALPGNMTGHGVVSMRIPMVAPSGVYGVRVGVGDSADDPRSSDLTVLTIE